MTRLKDCLICLLLALLCALAGLSGYIGVKYVIPTLQNVRKASDSLPQTMNSLKESADTSNMASTVLLDTLGTVNYKTLPAMNQLLASGTQTLNAASDLTATLGKQTGDIAYHADATLDKLDAAIDSITTIPPHVNQALDGATNFTKSAQLLISDPVIKGTLDNLSLASLKLARLEDSLNTSVKHVDSRWLAPWDGSHPVKHRLGQIGNIGLQLGGISSSFWRDSK